MKFNNMWYFHLHQKITVNHSVVETVVMRHVKTVLRNILHLLFLQILQNFNVSYIHHDELAFQITTFYYNQIKRRPKILFL
jgi:hypothetical protein